MHPPKSKKKPDSELTPAARALRLVARRDYTRRELSVKLAPHVPEAAELEALLDDFTARGWLSEARVVEQLVYAKRGRLGAARIRQALLQRGVGEELIASAVKNLKESELERARAVCARKFAAAPVSAEDRARRVRFLQGRGFSTEVAMRAVGRGD